MTNKTNTNKWTAPQRKGIKSVDVSAVVFKPTIKMNPYLRTPTYRKQKSVSMIGTNSEVY
jgi:hypothetical protein